MRTVSSGRAASPSPGGAPRRGLTEEGASGRPSAARRGVANLAKMLVGHVGTVVVVTASGFLIPRFLGADAYGQYAAVVAVVVLLQALSSLGLQQVEMRYLAPLWTGKQQEEAVALASTLWATRLALGSLAGLVAVLWLRQSTSLELGSGVIFAAGAFCFLRAAFEATKGLFLPLGHVGKLSWLELGRAVMTLPVVILAFGAFGLRGVFLLLLPLYGLLLLAGTWMLLRVIPLRPAAIRWSALRQHWRFSAHTFVSTTANNLYTQFSIYAVAMWVSRSEAAFVAIVVRLYALARGLLLASRRALMPIMAEIEEEGGVSRLRNWGEVMLRFGVAAATLASLAWALLGRDLVLGLLGSSFGTVFPAGVIMTLAIVAFAYAAVATGLLFVRGRAGIVAINASIYALAAGLGLFVALQAPGSAAAERVAMVYAWSSLLHALLAYCSLGLAGGIWLPLGRALLLGAPALLALPLSTWQAPVALRAAILGSILVGYACLAVRLQLVPWRELSDLRRVLARRSEGQKAKLS